MDKFLEIKQRFESREDKENAAAMSKYMRNMFDFYGLPAPRRKEVYHDVIRSDKKEKAVDWGFLDKCYDDEHREFQYLVYDYLLALKEYVTFDDIPRIKYYITTYNDKILVGYDRFSLQSNRRCWNERAKGQGPDDRLVQK